jgi:hypothetical protein
MGNAPVKKAPDAPHLRRKWPFMFNWDCGGYITSVQWVQGGYKVNQSPGITVLWSDSTQNSSVNGYSAAPGHISHESEEGRTDRWPLRAAGLVSGLWRCDERLLWYLFVLCIEPSCLGWAVLMQVWGLVPLVLSCWLDRLWSLPSFFWVVFAFLVVRLVSGPWRCDERLFFWHLFALEPSCLGQCYCRCGPFVRG